MKHTHLKRHLKFPSFLAPSIIGSFLTAIVFLSTPSLLAQARPGKSHAVGTGVVYPTLNHSLFVNPAGLVDSPRISLQGAYLIDPENIHSSLTIGRGIWGMGLGYRQAGSSSIEELGLALKANILNLGLTARSSEFENFNYDLGATFDLGDFRMGVVVRNITSNSKRYDFGLGMLINQATLEFDVKTDANDFWHFDAAISVGTQVSVGFGYAVSYFNNDFYNGTIHAGVSIPLTQKFSVEAFYRPHSFEWSPGDWVVGAKLIL